MDRMLFEENLNQFLGMTIIGSTTKFKKAVEVQIKTETGIIKFLIPKKRISTSSIRLFILWAYIAIICACFDSFNFFKNQTRPIVNLAKAAEKFGKGDYVNEFRPSGASEIRKASYEFDRMVKRINRHLNQRSEMLSGISHDLRTPLTRLKLQLALIKEKEISKKMSKDIDEMEKMLNDYLQFAKSQVQEKTTSINMVEFLNELIKDFNNNNIRFNNEIQVFL